ncbi:helix-turn-helix transcriptional regulator [Paraburkholderia fynbosensis]|uniref:helix-turn-helix transcriptional regulator n=1 Tax=Paraburkholderia fynbosensis TaxID=1200993 RepID=UPI001581D668|nr:helix-turn-helix transcriptional regulator [Paraburkholderia fynbosensis]
MPTGAATLPCAITEGVGKVTSSAPACGHNRPGQFAAARRRHFGYSPSDVRKREPVPDEPSV